VGGAFTAEHLRFLNGRGRLDRFPVFPEMLCPRDAVPED
jgi:hypothetical protein